MRPTEFEQGGGATFERWTEAHVVDGGRIVSCSTWKQYGDSMLTLQAMFTFPCRCEGCLGVDSPGAWIVQLLNRRYPQLVGQVVAPIITEAMDGTYRLVFCMASEAKVKQCQSK